MMNGQQGNDQQNQMSQEAQLAFLLNAAGQNGGLMAGLSGAHGGMGGGLFGGDSLEEQILQRASALRTEALVQQQRQQAQQNQQFGGLAGALSALQQQQSMAQQQQQLASLVGLNPASFGNAFGGQEQEAILARAAALRELGVPLGAGHAPGGLQASAPTPNNVGSGSAIERLQQLELGRLEDLDKRRQQLAALAGISGKPALSGDRAQAEIGQDSVKSSNSDAERLAALASANSENKSKEDLRKTPGTVIVPCRARGMPMDHNFKTAYFVISEDAKHGEDLVCSYFACRNGGVKFRYCAHCMAPVAKRNFCRRHDHGMSKVGDGEANEEDEGSMDRSENSATKDNAEDAAPAKKKEAKNSLDALTNAASSKFLKSEKSKKRKKPSEDKKDDQENSADEMDMENGDAAPETMESHGVDSISAERKELWAELLTRRPRTKDPRHLSAWLNEVLTVSEFDIPLDQIELPPAPMVEPDPEPDSLESDDDEKEKPIEEEEEAKPEEKKPKKKKQKTKQSDEDSTSSKSGKEEEKKKDDKAAAPRAGGDKAEANGDKAKANGDKAKSPKKAGPKDSSSPSKSSSPKKESEDGFSGSFADWRDRKKEKALKKGTGSLRK